MKAPRFRNEPRRWAGAIGVSLLSMLSLAATVADEPVPPVEFKGKFSIADGTLPPELGRAFSLGAFAIPDGGTSPARLHLLNPPFELDKVIDGRLCWDNFCSSFLNPPPFDNQEFTGATYTYGTYFCGTGPTLCGTSFQLYFYNSDIVACPNSGCVKDVDIRFYSRFGTVKGRVTLRDGTPAIGRTVLAKDPEGKLKPVSTSTDAYGFYDFTAKFAPVEPDHPAYGKVFPPIPLDDDNHWGLTVYGDGLSGRRSPEYYSSETGKKEWQVGLPPVGPPVLINVRGGEAARADFIVPLPEDEDDPDKQDCFTEGEPVSIMTGNVFFHQIDASMKALRRTLALVRTYNSQNAYHDTFPNPLFGPGWSHSFESRLFFPTSYRGIVLKRANGVPVYYTDPEGDGTYGVYLPLAERSWLVQSGDTYTRHLLDGSLEVYNAAGYLTRQIDVFGGETALEYNAVNRPTRITAPGGRFVSFTYGFDDIRLSGPEGLLATYGIARFFGSRLDRVDYPDGSGFRFVYDSHGQLTLMLDATGRVVERHEYVGDKATTSEVGDGKEKFQFDYAPGRTTATDALGNASVYEFGEVLDDKVLTRVTGPCSSCGGAGQFREWTYDGSARVESLTDGLGNATRYTYDAAGNLATETNALNETTAFTYDARGRMLSRLGPDGALSAYTYGPFGLLTKADALGRTAAMEYDGRGLPASVRNPGGEVFTLAHNDFGDLTSVTDPLSRSVTYEYDAMGRQILVRDSIGTTARFSYDPRGRLRRVTRADGSVTEINFDLGGRMASVSDASGASTRYLYNDAGRLERVVDPLNGLTTLGYDLMLNLISVTDARGKVTRFEYDGFRQLTGITYPDGAVETSLYDAAGRLASHTDPKGTIITFLPDKLGRLRGKAYSDGTPPVSYDYDAAGRMIGAANGTDTLTWSYDLAGQLLSERSAKNQSLVEYGYDLSGNRISLRLDEEPFAGYTYDPVSRLRSISYGSDSFRFEYDDGLRRTRLLFPNGVTTSYGYGPASRLTEITAYSGGTSIAALGYGYDIAGRVTSRDSGAATELYSYDALSRLVSVNRTGTDPRHWGYSFDAVSNRTSAMDDDQVTASAYNERNQLQRRDPGGSLLIQGVLDEPGTVAVDGKPASLLAGNRFETTVDVPAGATTVEIAATDGSGNVRTSTYEVDETGGPAAFQYDASGNLIERIEAATVWKYEWNGENEITRVLANGAEVARFAYDPLGRRVEKATPVATTAYTYDQDGILREAMGPAVEIRYVHGPGVDEPLAADRNGERSFYHLDALGSVVSTTNAAGELVSAYQYDAFGNPEGDLASGYAYTGREWDKETGLYYYRARYYDPRAGRFLSEDPIGFAGGPNLYEYVGGSPVNFRDPSGTQWMQNMLDSAAEAYNRLQASASYESVRGNELYEKWLKRIERWAPRVHVLLAARCLAVQALCENRTGKTCRCDTTLSAAGQASCDLQVSLACSKEALSCLAHVGVEAVLLEGLVALAP